MKQDEWLLLNSGAGPSAYNMALDEALLEAMPRLNRPVLRFYGWHEPAATFGYFQHFSEVERLTPLRPLIRRPTGGGIVPHENDWTYSVAIPTTHEWYEATAVESYRRIHDWIRAAFAQLGMITELAPVAIKTLPGQCFVGCERYDLLLTGRKIAGAAQRRRRDGLLIQGSLQCPENLPSRSRWELAMCRIGSLQGGILWVATGPDLETRARADALAADKYSQAGYNARR